MLETGHRLRSAEPLIFVNYRSRDDGAMAVLVKRELSAVFGDDAIFLDFESIPLGQDFSRMLLDGARRSAVLLVLIGRDWEGRVGSRGRLIDDPGDWVRREIAAALAAGVVVVPVLIGDRPVLVAEDLPVEIARLARLQYARIRHRSQGQDLVHLVDRLKALPAVAAELGDTPAGRRASAPPVRGGRWLLPLWALVLGAAAAVAVLVVVFVDLPSSKSSTGNPSSGTNSAVSVSILSPTINSLVDWKQPILIKVSGITEDQVPWIYIRGAGVQQVWPQRCDQQPDDAELFDCVGWYGEETASRGKQFRITAVVVDRDGNRILADLQRRNNGGGSSFELDQPPTDPVASSGDLVVTRR